MWPKFLKPTPIIYLVIEKIDPFIYLIDQNIDPFIHCPLIFIPIHILSFYRDLHFELRSILRAYTEGEYLVTDSRDRRSLQIPGLQIPIYRDARKDGPLIHHTRNLGLFIYCCVK